VEDLICGRSRLVWLVEDLVYRRSNLWKTWFGLACGRSGLWKIWFVEALVCPFTSSEVVESILAFSCRMIVMVDKRVVIISTA
jgi:hypothetical protein